MRVQVGCEEQRLQRARVLVHLLVVHEKDLLQSTHRPPVPVRVKVPSVRVAAHQVLGQDHDEPLEHDEEESLLLQIRCLQFLLQSLHKLEETKSNRSKHFCLTAITII